MLTLITPHEDRRHDESGQSRCVHQPRCPDATAPDALAASAIVSHPEQGWSLLCNRIIVFDDTGAITPAGVIIWPDRGRPDTGLTTQGPLQCRKPDHIALLLVQLS